LGGENVTEHTRHRIPKPPVREEWLAARAPFIGASEVAALFGEHPYLTAGDLALEKLGRIERTENAAMRRGVILEDAVAQWWAVEHDRPVFEPEVLFMVDDVLIATLDRLLITDGDLEALEVKTTAHHISEPERYWWWQCQAQCIAAGLQRVHIAALDATLDLRSFTIERDLEAGERIIKACEEFMTYVRAGELPPDAPISYATAQALYPTPSGARVELDERAEFYLGLLRMAIKRLQANQLEVDRLKGMLTNTLGEASEGTLDGELVCTWRAVTTHTIDGKRLREELPNVAAEYGRATTARRLLLK
jgi:putative phage-type endonuclease